MLHFLCLILLIQTITGVDLQLRLMSSNGHDIDDKILFEGNALILDCWLEDSFGVRANQGYSDINWTLVNPVVTISNNSWLETFQFPPVSNDNLSWHIDIPRLNFTTDGNYWFPKEQWLVSANVKLEQEMYTKQMSLLDVATEPILHWMPGMEMPATALPSGDDMWYSSVSPCAADVVVVARNTITGQLAMKVTRAAFVGNSTDSFLLDLCSVMSNCSGVELLDLVLTNHHVLLLTSGGLLVSNNISAPVEGSPHSNRHNLTWTLINVSPGCSTILMGKFRYTRQCLSRIHDAAMGDILFATIKCQVGLQEETRAFRGTEPFSAWTRLVIMAPSSSSEILDVAYNLHMKTSAILYGKQYSTIGLQIQTYDINGIVQPLVDDYFFPPGVNVTTIEFESVSHTLFAYGQQVWYSTDGGNYFNQLHTFPEGTWADHMTFDHHGNKYLVHSNSGSMLYSMIGSSRMLTLIDSLTSLTVPYAAIIDFIGNVIVANLTAEPVSQKLDISGNIQAWSQTLPHNLVPVQTGASSAVLYEYADGATVSCLDKTFLGQLVSYSGGGSGIIKDIDLATRHPDFLSATTIVIVEAFAMDTASTNLESPLHIEWQGPTVELQLTSAPSPGWTTADIGRNVVVLFTDTYLITVVTSTTLATAVSPLQLNASWTVPSGQWRLLTLTPTIPAWKLKEDECRHVLTSDPQQQLLIEMDIHDTTSLHTLAKIAAPLGSSARPHLHISLSNEHLVNTKQEFKLVPSQSIQNATITMTKDSNQRGVLAVRVWSPTASLQCPRAAVVYTVHLSCPCRKRLVYNRPKLINKTEYLYGNPIDREGAVLFDLVKNYRPPSQFGVDIPTAQHMYNADPSLPRPNDRFRISKESGSYKQCQGKPNHTACACTQDMMYSDDAAYSDCKQRVYRLLHPGILYPEFIIEQPGLEDQVMDSQKHLVYMWEINNRVPEFKPVSRSELLVSVSSDPRLATQASKWFTPGAVKVIMVRSGLHHFRAELPPGFSFCPLYAEFQVYVDQTPIAYPLHHILRFTVALILGGIMFVVYLWYLSQHHTHLLRSRGSQCQDLQDVHQYETGQYPPSKYYQKMLSQ